MTEANMLARCSTCGGTGKIMTIISEIPTEIDCTVCGGIGKVPCRSLDTTDIMAELDYIHGKVTAIWNIVKPGG